LSPLAGPAVNLAARTSGATTVSKAATVGGSRKAIPGSECGTGNVVRKIVARATAMNTMVRNAMVKSVITRKQELPAA